MQVSPAVSAMVDRMLEIRDFALAQAKPGQPESPQTNTVGDMATQFGTESGREFLESVNALPGQVSPNDTFIPTDYSDPHRVELEREVFLAEKKFEANPSKENEQALSNANLALTEYEEYIVIMNSTDEFTDSVQSDRSGYR